VQPLVSGRASLNTSIVYVLVAIILFFIGVVLSSLGGNNNE